MAFCRKFSSLIGRTSLRNSLSDGPVAMMPWIGSIRCMSSTKLFIGGLSYGTDEQSLKEAFESCGNVTEARVITDRDTGRSRGFGFVNYDNSESADTALSKMDGQELDGRNIRVSYANERPSGGGGFRGGFNDGFQRDGYSRESTVKDDF